MIGYNKVVFCKTQKNEKVTSRISIDIYLLSVRFRNPLWGTRYRFMNNKVTYRQQFTRCGKQRCRKCKEGAGHGPYWYAYWSENGRTVSKYIGVNPPDGIELKPVELKADHELASQ